MARVLSTSGLQPTSSGASMETGGEMLRLSVQVRGPTFGRCISSQESKPESLLLGRRIPITANMQISLRQIWICGRSTPRVTNSRAKLEIAGTTTTSSLTSYLLRRELTRFRSQNTVVIPPSAPIALVWPGTRYRDAFSLSRVSHAVRVCWLQQQQTRGLLQNCSI